MQRKASKNTRGPNQAEKDFQGWLKQQPCCITGANGVQVHHCVGSTGRHNKVLIGHWFCLPLSPSMHEKYHSGTKAWRINYGLQCDHWLTLAVQYERETGKEVPQEVCVAIAGVGK